MCASLHENNSKGTLQLAISGSYKATHLNGGDVDEKTPLQEQETKPYRITQHVTGDLAKICAIM